MLTHIIRSKLKSEMARLLLRHATWVLPLTLCACSKQTPQTNSDQGPPVIKVSARGGAVSVVSVGDILLGNASSTQLANQGYDWSFEHVQPLLGSADLVIGNLAAPVTTSTKKQAREKGEKDYAYKLSHASAAALKRAGFHAVSLGNNHILDYGMNGLRDTLAILRTNDLVGFGAGDNEEEARRGVIYDFGTVRIGVLGYGEEGNEAKSVAKGERGGYALLAEKNLAADIPQMRAHADVVLVSVHWGKNYKDVTDAQHKLGQRAIELGADIVCGHHPHIAQGIEVYKGKPIMYSLGNFVFGTRGRFPDDKQGYGLVSRLVFEGKALKWVLATPIAVNNDLVKFQPRRVPAEEAKQSLEGHLKRYGTHARWEGDTAFIGFGSEWESAALPNVPWKKSGDLTTNATPVATLEANANP